MNVFSNKKIPENGSYILGNQNHVGYYHNGYVYYFGFTEARGYPRKARLKDWCQKWAYLRACCVASKEEYVAAMGEIVEYEPEKYIEVQNYDKQKS